MNDVTSRLAHMPVALFATVMGMGGLTLAWKKASEVLGITNLVWQVLLVITAVLLATLAISYLLKMRRHAHQVIAEFNHPIKISFFPAFSIGLMLIAVALAEIMAPLATAVWWMGASIQLILTLYLMNQWIHHARWQVQHTTPAWFIPIVGNIIAPIGGVTLGFTEVSWFFFAIGIVYWIVLKVLVFNRIIFHEPLPEKLLPTLFIMIAPPAVGFIAYLKLNQGVVDNFAHILYYAAMFLVLLLVSQLPRFARIPFFVSWWAYSFPIAAFTIGTLIMFEQSQTLFFQTLSHLMLTLVSILLTVLIVKTVKAAIKGSIFQPD
ncbi:MULTISPECIES: SLAC1 anion channel family protein [unclassified Marinobacterium]|uniref:SLAC1 anion channel family protein n=1 Tax=unclassified Marinobacterium TaxID=2644139 RepID=UPI0015694FF8|nr:MULTISPECIES: SLAC1 anion channel family protein [unclassified Marinobacterium]NRP47152.1 Tellurite resistance protein TehA [Marinobacterium sp. xm-d-543]NRQ22883.1 Tellurite resistance protein TehA [Marinobacterium sp. xm-m-312]